MNNVNKAHKQNKPQQQQQNISSSLLRSEAIIKIYFY
jgi:hypothetical protein